MSTKLSIIVPVFNSEKYLRKSLSCVVAQEFTDWECICIDDGSTDSSADILADFVKLDKRFHLIRQENAGVSAARNNGLESAAGDWVSFFDSDDLLESDFYSKMFARVEEHPAADVIVGFIKILNIDGSVCQSDSKPNSNVVTGDVLAQVFRTDNMGIAYCMSDKICRRRLMADNAIIFLRGVQTGEDSLFCQAVLAHSRYAVIDGTNQGYIYWRHSDSLSNTVTIAKIMFNVSAVLASLNIWQSARTYGSLLFARQTAVGYFFAAAGHKREQRLLFYEFLSNNAHLNRQVLPFLLLHGSLGARLLASLLLVGPRCLGAFIIRVVAEKAVPR